MAFLDVAGICITIVQIQVWDHAYEFENWLALFPLLAFQNRPSIQANGRFFNVRFKGLDSLAVRFNG